MTDWVARIKAQIAQATRRPALADGMALDEAVAAAGNGLSAANPTRPGARAAARDTEFLPAALEIVETPPSPIGRAIVWTIVAFVVAALTWAYYGEIDIIVTAPGKIIPTGRTKIIQPLEIGIVRAVNVQEGDLVKAGQVLVELDLTTTGAERDRLISELLSARLDSARLRAALTPGDDPAAAFVVPEGASESQIALQNQLLVQLLSENRSKLASLDRQKAQHDADRAAVAANISKLEESLPLLRERTDARHILSDKGYGSRMTYLEQQQDLVEHEHELLVQKSRLVEAGAALSSIEEEYRRTQAEFRRNVLNDLTQAEQKASSLEQELIKAQDRNAMQTLTAPVDGVVQQIQIHTLGGVVTPAQTLMAIVPADSRYEIEATVQNKDIGFVSAGQDAEVKIDTFNFTRYGLLHGTVLSLSQDAVQQNRSSAASGGGAAAAATQATGIAPDGTPNTSQDFAYVARVSLDRTTMEVEGKAVSLGAGMAVTVEIKTGKRRLIEYVLSPLLRYKQESLRER